MNNPADWFLPASWEISGGTMNATLEDLDANQVTGTVIGRQYLTYFETSNISNGETRIKVGETGGIVRSTTGAWDRNTDRRHLIARLVLMVDLCLRVR